MGDATGTVLLVDDDSNVIEGLIRHLRKEPYRVLSALSAQEALRILAKEKIDVIITDEQMPSMTGAELVSRVRKQYPSVVCMMLSGNTNFDAAIQAINEGEIYRFLRKPCDPLDVATDIRLALEQRHLVVHARETLDRYQEQLSWIKNLEKKFPGISNVEYDEKGCIVIGPDDKSELDPKK